MSLVRMIRIPSLIVAMVVAMIAPTASAKGNLPPAAADGQPPSTAPRSWALGLGYLPPRPTVSDVLKGIDMWSQRAELAAIHEELPWKDLLGGMSAEAILDRDKVELVKYLRSKGLKLYFMAELNDGLSRGEEAPQLRALGRSITEPAVQQAYRNYVLAVERKLKPDYIGLAAETNLVRQAASPKLYTAMVTAANAAARDLRAAGSKVPLMTSIQVETAWGVLGRFSDFSKPGTYVGVDKDFVDFPFVQIMGLSSYPYLSYASPDDIPDNHFSRPLRGHSLPVMIVEGGWTSASVATVNSSPQLQARYFSRLAQLADNIEARAIIQLMFADLDANSFPKPQPKILPLFTRIGLVNDRFKPKPALAVWDRMHARQLITPP